MTHSQLESKHPEINKGQNLDDSIYDKNYRSYHSVKGVFVYLQWPQRQPPPQ